MAEILEVRLDVLITKKEHNQRLPRGRPASGGGPAPADRSRRVNTRAAAAPYPRSSSTLFQGHAKIKMAYGPKVAVETPTKLYISNLDRGVTAEDIMILFSKVGKLKLKRCSINYDRRGRSRGTAEVLFSTRSDALAAVKKYNNIRLDGKRMKIEIAGTNIDAPPTPTVPLSPPYGNFSTSSKSRPGMVLEYDLGAEGGARAWARGTWTQEKRSWE